MTQIKRNIVRIVMLCMVMMCGVGTAWGQTAATLETGDYFIRNVGTGLFLNGANSWGTKASATPHGQKMTLEKKGEGVYTIDSHISNGGANHFVNQGDNLFVDGAAVNHTIEEVETGVYTIKDPLGKYLFNDNNAGNTVNFNADDASSDRAKWQILTHEQLLAEMLTATPGNAKDATFFVGDANFSRNNQYQSSWTMEASNKNLSGGDNTNNCAESYKSTFTLSQKLNGAPNGIYRLKAQGFYRQDGAESEPLPYIYVGDAKGTFNLLQDASINSMALASVAFSSGQYQIAPITANITDGNVTIGAKLETNTSLWCIWDNFELEFLGQLPTVEYGVSGGYPSATFKSLPTNGTVMYRKNAGEFVAYTDDEVITVTERTTIEYKVRYSDGQESDVLSFVLDAPEAPELTVSPTVITGLMVHDSQAIIVTTNSDGEVTYTVDNPSIVSVSSDGVVTALAVGIATITVNVASTPRFIAAHETVTVTAIPDPYIYRNNYEDGVIQWTTGTGGRYTPLIMTDDTKYVSVNQGERNNNGTTITSNETASKVAAGNNFTMMLRVKLGASTNQTNTAFNIFDATGNTQILRIAEVTTNATKWTINNNAEHKATVSTGGNKGINELNWVYIQVTYNEGRTYLTLKDGSGNVIDEYEKKLISTLTANGGLGKMTFETSRYNANFAIDDIFVRDVQQEDLPVATPIKYTVRFTLEDGTEFMEAKEYDGYEGFEYNAESDAKDFVYNDQKYIYLRGNETKVAESTGNEIVLVFREAAQYHYSLLAVDPEDNVLETLVPSTPIWEGDAETVAFPQYVLNGGKLYRTATTSGDYYRIVITPTSDDYVTKLVYENPIDDIVFYTEVENLLGVTSATNLQRASNAGMGHTGSVDNYVQVTTLQQGRYQIYIRTVNGNASAHNFRFKVGDSRVVWAGNFVNSVGLEDHSGVVYVGEESTLSFASEGSSSAGIDNLYIQYIGEFDPTPVYTRNLGSKYTVIADTPKTLLVRANNTDTYTWYQSDTKDEEGTIVQEAATMEDDGNRLSVTHTTDAADTYYYCVATGFTGETVKSVVACVSTINEAVPGALAVGYTQDYESAVESDWISRQANVGIGRFNGSAAASVGIPGANGTRSAFLPLHDALVNETPDHFDNDWQLDFDFTLVVNDKDQSNQSLQIYKDDATFGDRNMTAGYNQALANGDCFFTIQSVGNTPVYTPVIADVADNDHTFTLTQGDLYHLSISVLNNVLSVNITDDRGNPVYTYSSASPFANDRLLGGIIYSVPARNSSTAYAYFDNIKISVNTTDLAINSDLPTDVEGNDDEYINDGAGLNFDVPAATEFEWYVSSVMPEKGANGTTEPRLEDDGSVTWTNGTAFMTVESPVGRATTEITKTRGVATNSADSESKHAVTPAADNEGKYAMRLKTQYPTVKTVWDEATVVNYNDGTADKTLLRYYPEATASGSRWHYLRQLDVQNAEADHLDYVWCVAKNPLGEVTSKITQINIYPMMPQIYLEDEYMTENANGSRADMTLPAIYKFRTYRAEIHAVNLIFNTVEKPVPYATRSLIHYKDEVLNTYEPTDEVAGPTTQWKYNEDIWSGVISTTTFTYFDETLNANASVHGFYKSIPRPLPVDFAYGLLQQRGMPYHDITKGAEKNSIAEYVIGPRDNVSLQATQDIHFDYGRYKDAEVQLQPVSTKTVWDWNALPQRKFLTYNLAKNDAANIYTVGGVKQYVIDPDTKLAGPEMGQKYVMANFYGYGVEELGGFPSDKVKIGLEYVNNPAEKCMQGDAFIIKPASTGILEMSFSKTDEGENVYLTLNYDDKTQKFDTKTSSAHGRSTATNVTMTITADMVGKEVSIKACKASDNAADQYFNVYSATYTPDAKPVEFAEWVADARAMVASGGEDSYTQVSENSDGYVSLTTTTEGATIKFKIVRGTDKPDVELNAIAADIDNLDAEEQTYKEDVYVDYLVDGSGNYVLDAEGNKQVRNKIGIHCATNSTIFAWTEKDAMNRSEVTWHKTKAQVYPVDMRFMYNFDNCGITTQEAFDTIYWDNNEKTIHQSDLSSHTDLSNPDNITFLKSLSTTTAPKAWTEAAKKYGKALIDDVEYTEENFDKFFITHGTTIDIFVNPESKYEFNGWGAPSFSTTEGKVVDMMRYGEKAKHVHYRLLYDKAKAATTAGIAFLIANFTDREEDFSAKMMMKAGDAPEDTYNIDMTVLKGDKIIAPIYHSAHDADGMTVTHWTDDYGLDDTEDFFEDYMPGEPKQIYEDTQIVPVYRPNAVADNYRGRSVPMHATWWFTTDHHAQPLNVRNEYPGFNMPYVAPVRRHEIGTASEFLSDGVTPNPDDIWFDFPLTITPTATGRVENTVVPDWCSVGRGTRFTMPACKDAVVQMEVRSRLSDAATGTKFGGETPQLIKIKVKRANTMEYYEVDDVSNVTLGDTIYSYTYEATYTGNAETLDVVIGSDYSYIRNISLTLPVIISKRDAALVTLDFVDLARHLDVESLGYQMAGYPQYAFLPKTATPSYGQGHTGDGYQFDHKSENISLYKTHYSGEDGAIYYDGVSPFMVLPGMGQEVPDNVPYVNGILGYTYSTGVRAQDNLISQSTDNGAFIVGPFRSITHIRYKQGSSLLEGGGWTMTIGRQKMNWDKDLIQKDDMINKADDPRRVIPDFSQVRWGAPKMGAFHNSTSPEWVEMDIEEHIYPDGKDKSNISLIEDAGYDNMDGDIWLRFQADKPDVYLFAIEIYGVASTSEQQVTLRTNNMVAANDDAIQYEPTFIAGDIFHFPYLLHLDESYNPVSRLLDTEDKLLQFNEGCEVTLTANPNTGYDFLKWIEWNEETEQWDEVSRQNPYKFNINKSTQVRAVFVPRGIINYTAQGTRYGIVPEPVQTDRQGGFTVAENRSLYAGDGQSLRRWQDTEPMNEWYTGAGAGQSKTFKVSTNMVSGSTPSVITRSRGELGTEVDVQPEFSDNTLSLLDIVGRIGATARWQFGKKNGAPTMEGHGTTPRLVTQVSVTGKKDILDEESHTINNETVTDTIDVSMEMHANVNNAGRADAYATVDNDATFTLPSTKGVRVDIGTSSSIEYSMDGGTTWIPYERAFNIYKRDPSITLQLRSTAGETMELEYIQATYHQRAQKPVLSMQNVDVIDDPEHHATNNVQVQVQTNSNPTAVRFYTVDGSDPSYVVEGNTVRPTGTTRQVRGNYITINEAQIGSGTTLKVLSVCSDRPDSEIATLDLEQYDKDLGLATYVYDSRIINIHEDQIFLKLKAEHKGHFNLLSYDLNPDAAVIPSVITDHTTVFITSDAVVDHLKTALTDPSDPAAHGQTFAVEPLIVGTPLYISWKKSAAEGAWTHLPWSKENVRNDATPTSPATITYTEYLRAMKNAVIRDDADKPVDQQRTYAQYYADQIQAAGGKYVLAFYDGMLLDGSEVCISNTTDNAPENLSANGTQLVFNATELLTRITDGEPADVSTFNSTVATLMAPSKNPQLIDVKMSYTKEVIDFEHGDSEGWIAMDAPMLSDLSDGLSVKAMPYLSKTYPQFVAGTIAGKGQVTIKNVETYNPERDNIATAEKLGAQGIDDLATIITVTNTTEEIRDYHLDSNFKREYRIEYHIALDSLTFRKVGDQWVCEGNENCTITEKNSNGEPLFKLHGPINFGIKDVCFNGYAVAPDNKFDPETGELLPDDDGQHNNTIWGQGEKFDDDDPRPSPTAHSVTGMSIPEYPEDYDGEKTGLPEGQWMEAHFPWGFENNYQMAFSLLNITDYVGEIKVRFYRQQADAPELIETNIYDNMEVPANGDFVMKFNTIMHQVRKPGLYDDGIVTWAAHIIPDDLGGGIKYGDILEDDNRDRLIDEYDTHEVHIPLAAEGGTNTLTFQYWHLEEGKKYWLHIPFHILRSDVGECLPYEYPASVTGLPEEQMSYTNYVGTDDKAVPYFDIPFTVTKSQYNHKAFNYIVNNDNWWDAYKDAEKGADQLPSYAQWDGTFAGGIDKIQEMAGRPGEHPRFYMHVQKQLDSDGNPVAYSLGEGNAGLIRIDAGNFSIVGEGRDSTLIYANVDRVAGEGNEGLREGNNTATLHIDGDDVYLQDFTIENAQMGDGSSGQEYPALYSHGERHTLYNVEMKAYEETFASFGTLTYLEKCMISGYGDLVVGSGDVWLEQSKLILRDRHMINLCKAATKATEKWGFVFNDCHIDREEGADNVLDHNWTLARPWGGYDEAEVLKSPAATFLKTQFTVLPTNTGYAAYTPDLRLRFHEYGSYKNNPDNHAPLSMRSVANCSPTYDSDYPVLNEEQAAEYSIRNVFGRDNNGYDPQSLTRQAEAPVLTNDGMVLHWNTKPENLCYLVYYLGDGEQPDWDNAMMFCCVPGTDEEEAYCNLTDHDQSPIFRTKENDKPIAFFELWYGEWNTGNVDANGDPIMEAIPGMGKESPSRLWFAVRAANQMGGLSPMSDPLLCHAARQYRTSIKQGGVLKGDDSGNAYSTIYLDFQALAPKGVKAYALTGVSSKGGDDNGTGITTLTFERVNNNDNYQDVVYPDQGYLIYGSYGTGTQDYDFIETTSIPRVELTSYLSGTVGTFKNHLTEPGYGELNGVNSEIGWSISFMDYDDLPRVNISAFTLQKYNDMLGFYKFTGQNFAHHRAYLDTEVAAQMLMEGEGMSQSDANDALNRGMRFIIRESNGEETVIDGALPDGTPAHGIYDLMGRRIPSHRQLQPGHIYIIDGQKVKWKGSVR